MTDLDERLRTHAARWQATAVLPDVPDLDALGRRRGWASRAWLAAAAAVAVLVAGGVVVARDDALRATAPYGRVPAEELDRHRDLAGFFDGVPSDGGTGPYPSLRAAYDDAQLVVVARIERVTTLREVPDGNGTPYYGLELAVAEVLRGEPPADRPLVVGFKTTADLASRPVPDGYAVWTLQLRGRLPSWVTSRPSTYEPGPDYEPTSRQGVLVQGETSVASPLREPGDPIASEAANYARLSELVAYLRTLG